LAKIGPSTGGDNVDSIAYYFQKGKKSKRL